MDGTSHPWHPYFLILRQTNHYLAKDLHSLTKYGGIGKSFIKPGNLSLKDLDYQTWQIIVYPSSQESKNLILRIVGYPGSLRIDHPTKLIVKSGIKNWNLKDITKKSKIKLETLNDSLAEFDLSPIVADLDKNRPLRLKLPGLINDLPIPPYLVSEWRSLSEKK